MKSIPVHQVTDRTVAVPGSKSYTHRALIAAALSDSHCTVSGMLRSDDTRLTLCALQQLVCPGRGQRPSGSDLRYSRTARFGRWSHRTGQFRNVPCACSPRWPPLPRVTPCSRDRPAWPSGPSPTFSTLWNKWGCQPAAFPATAARRWKSRAAGPPGGRVRIDCHLSSQFLSAVLLIAPCCRQDVTIEVLRGPVSRPYVDLTCAIMQRCGIRLERQNYNRFSIPAGQRYRASALQVEADCSQASYFWAAAAVTGGRVTVQGIGADSLQGDLGFLKVLEQMGCRFGFSPAGAAVTGGPLDAVNVDMSDMPDVVPTLAVVAAFARGTTTIRGVAHLREKESDRLGAVAAELERMGIQTETGTDWLRVHGGQPHGATIETYDDHRLAMSFAVAGLRVPGGRHPPAGGGSQVVPQFLAGI